MRRPNILLIMTDEHTPKVTGFAGDPHVHTQHLDELAERSVRFDTAVCASPACTPSRMCMLTGKDVHRCAAWNNHWILFPEHTTWPAHFTAHGYRTCLVGKMHYGGKNQLNGFQVRPYGDMKHGLGHQPDPLSLFPGYASAESAGESEIPESLMSDIVTTREALSFLYEQTDREPDIPWFVCASYTRPHSPFTAPGRYIRRYRDAVACPPPAAGFRENLDKYTRDIHDAVGYSNLTEDQTKKGVEGYYACVDFVDDCIGELLEGLSREGILENTIIIYTSDHGEMLGQHGLWGKGVYYEPSIAVPLLMSGPGIAEGRVNHPVSLMDLFPTCCKLADLPVPEGLDGIDLSPVLSRPSTADPPREFAPSSFFKYGIRVEHYLHAELKKPGSCRAMRVCREKDWKYVAIEGGEPLLFDMVNDPEENTNLAERQEHSERCRKMEKKLFGSISWEQIRDQLAEDRARLPEFYSGLKPTTPNQYRLPDGRIFDAEGSLYEARWLAIPGGTTGGIIPQMFG